MIADTKPAARAKRGGRSRKEKTATVQVEGPAIKQPRDREAAKRLLRDSDLKPAEIAEKTGCEVNYVYMLRHAMKKNGELPAD